MRNIHRPERSATAVRQVEVKARAHELWALFRGCWTLADSVPTIIELRRSPWQTRESFSESPSQRYAPTSPWTTGTEEHHTVSHRLISSEAVS